MVSRRLAILPALALFLAVGGSALADEPKAKGLELQNEATGGSVSGNRSGDLRSTGAPGSTASGMTLPGGATSGGGDGVSLGGGMHEGLNVQYGNKSSFGLGGGSSETAEGGDGSKSK